MTADNTSDHSSFNESFKPKLPGGLHVLTILTIIGCVIQFLGSLWGFFNAKKQYEGIGKLSEQMNAENIPSWVKSLMGDPENMIKTITKSYENQIPIVLLSLAATALTFYAAMQMRKLKKQGFPLYVIGELLPFLTQFLFIGAFAFTGFVMYCAIAIALLFILLYFFQRKHLVN